MASTQTKFELAIRGGTVVAPDDQGKLVQQVADIGISNGKIEMIGNIPANRVDRVIDVKGLHIVPGLIDTQVHFREPGLEHKEDLATGTGSAILGGVTTIFDMPNTKPSTVGETELQDKLRRAAGRSWSNYAFYIAATTQNISQLPQLECLPGCAGIKVYMGSASSELLIDDDERLEMALASGKRRVAVHTEDERRLHERKGLIQGSISVHMHPVWRDEQVALNATQRLVAAAYKTKRPVHILHVTTRQEVEVLRKHKGGIVSAEVTPQHLTLIGPECYDDLGTLAQMNPPIRDLDHQEALWKGVQEGWIDIIGSDHAPHTREEKAKPYPQSPSGMPGVQTLTPVMLHHVNEKRLSLERFVEMTSMNPAKLYRVRNKGQIKVGFDADLTIVDLRMEKRISNEWIYSRCGWTPFDNMKVKGWPIATILKGQLAMKDDQLIGSPIGSVVEFDF